jgi:hypothetical protein
MDSKYGPTDGSSDCQTIRSATACFGRAVGHTTASGIRKTVSFPSVVSKRRTARKFRKAEELLASRDAHPVSHAAA